MNTIGKLIGSRRTGLGMSQQTLGIKVGVRRQYISQIELGYIRLSESDKMIRRIARALNLKVSKLYDVRPGRRLKVPRQTGGLGGFLAKRRVELQLTQDKVALRVHTRKYAISGYETGRFRPKTKMLAKLAKALQCDIPPDLIPPPRVRKNARKVPAQS